MTADKPSLIGDSLGLARAAMAVVGEWNQRGDGGCTRDIQDQLRAALFGDEVEECEVEEVAVDAPTSDVNVSGPDGPTPGSPPEITVGTVILPYYGDEARRHLYGQLDHVRRKHMEQFEPVTVTLPREVLTQAYNALRKRKRSRAAAAIHGVLDGS